MSDKEFLREINNDKKNPRQQKTINEDGFYDTDDCSHPDHKCTCGAEQINLYE